MGIQSNRGSHRNLLDRDMVLSKGTPVMQVIDIVKAKPVSRKDRDKLEDKSRDIIVKSITDGSKYISREELYNNYMHISGNKVKMKYLASGKWYTLVRRVNRKCIAVGIPLNNNVMINSMAVNGGNVILCIGNRVVVVTKTQFKKMFIVKFKPSVRNNRTANKIARKASNVEQARIKDEINRDIDNINERVKAEQNTNRAISSGKETGKYKIIANIVNAGDNVIGYVITDRKGVKHEIPKSKAMMLCKEYKIANAEVVRNRNQKEFIRGNGVRLEELPRYQRSK